MYFKWFTDTRFIYGFCNSLRQVVPMIFYFFSFSFISDGRYSTTLEERSKFLLKLLEWFYQVKAINIHQLKIIYIFDPQTS